MIKFIGFITEVDSNIPGAINFNEMFNKESYRSSKIDDRIINYLVSAPIISACMTYVRDVVDNEPIDGLTYHTDGEYIWPIYFPFYLKKYSFLKEYKGFIDHIKNNNFQIKSLNTEDLEKIEDEFDAAWEGK